MCIQLTTWLERSSAQERNLLWLFNCTDITLHPKHLYSLHSYTNTALSLNQRSLSLKWMLMNAYDWPRCLDNRVIESSLLKDSGKSMCMLGEGVQRVYNRKKVGWRVWKNPIFLTGHSYFHHEVTALGGGHTKLGLWTISHGWMRDPQDAIPYGWIIS